MCENSDDESVLFKSAVALGWSRPRAWADGDKFGEFNLNLWSFVIAIVHVGELDMLGTTICIQYI